MIAAFIHAMLAEYLSFIVLLFALYTVAGGILVSGDIRGTPWNNAAILALGTVMASIVGTTGAAMILIRPLIRANVGAPTQHPCVCFFHHSGGQCRRRIESAGRPAAVRRLPAMASTSSGPRDISWLADRCSWPASLLRDVLRVRYLALPQANRSSGQVDTAKPDQSSRPCQRAADCGHHRPPFCCRQTGEPGIAVDILGTRLELQNLMPRRGRCVADRIAFTVADAGRTPRGERLHLGTDQRKSRNCSPGSSSPSFPSWRCCDAGRRGFFAWLLSRGDGTGRHAARGCLFLVHRADVGISRQRADLSAVLQAGGRQPAGTDGRVCGDAGGDLDGRGLYGGADLYRERAEFDGLRRSRTERGIKMPSFFGYLLWAVRDPGARCFCC